MKIYLLRHEKRYNDRGFDTELTDEGFLDSVILKDKLLRLNIDKIYCSPYKRVIQTLEPFLQESNKSVNPEYGVYESLHLDNDSGNIREINNKLYGYNYFNYQYESVVNKDDLSYGETFEDIKLRSNKVITNLLNDKDNINKTILIACHWSVINAILNREEKYPFEMGEIKLFYDD